MSDRRSIPNPPLGLRTTTYAWSARDLDGVGSKGALRGLGGFPYGTRKAKRILVRLDVLDKALRLEDLNVPGLGFHRLQGFAPPRYTVHVNGPWCVTFEWDAGDAVKVDFEQYH